MTCGSARRVVLLIYKSTIRVSRDAMERARARLNRAIRNASLCGPPVLCLSINTPAESSSRRLVPRAYQPMAQAYLDVKPFKHRRHRLHRLHLFHDHVLSPSCPCLRHRDHRDGLPGRACRLLDLPDSPGPWPAALLQCRRFRRELADILSAHTLVSRLKQWDVETCCAAANVDLW